MTHRKYTRPSAGSLRKFCTPEKKPATEKKTKPVSPKQAAAAEAERLYWLFFDAPAGSPEEAQAEAAWIAALVREQDA